MKSIIQIILTLTIIHCQLSISKAQVAINTDSSTPDASAILDVKSTDKGVLIPRMTSVQRNAIMPAATGLLVFDTDTESFWFKNSAAWEELGASGVSNELADADGDTKIQVEESADEDIIRFDIGIHEQFKMENSKFTIGARGLSGSDIDLVFDSNTDLGGGLIKNEIKNILPSGFNTVDANYKMTFNVNGNKALTLNGAKSVKISDSYTLPTTDGTADQILTTDGNGNVDWTDFSTSMIQDIDGDTKIQVEESADEDVIRFDLANTEILRLSKNSNGITLVELPSSGANSTLYGQNAGVNISTGNNNTFIGKNTGQNTTTGANNTYIGRGAGLNATGSFNVFIGQGAGANETGSSKLYIDVQDTSIPLIYGEFDNNLVRINGSFNTTGNTTIDGTLSAGSTTINGNIQVNRNGSGTSFYPFIFQNSQNPNNARANGIRIVAGQNSENSGSRFLACTTPDGDEIGTIRQNGNSTVNFDTNSDIRLKTNIEPTQFGLADVLQIEVKDYDFKSELGRTRTGFIAQQLYEHYPEAVTVGGDDPKTDAWGVDYGKLTPVLVKAIQEQQAIIEAQQTEITRLKILELEVAQIKAMLQASTSVETAKAER